MTPFEDELRKALARREPPVDFTNRVLAKVAAQTPRARARDWFDRLRAWRLAAAAVAVLALAAGTVYQRHEREVRGAEAKRRLLVAIRIAGAKLQEAGERVKQVESAEATQ